MAEALNITLVYVLLSYQFFFKRIAHSRKYQIPKCYVNKVTLLRQPDIFQESAIKSTSGFFFF